MRKILAVVALLMASMFVGVPAQARYIVGEYNNTLCGEEDEWEEWTIEWSFVPLVQEYTSTNLWVISTTIGNEYLVPQSFRDAVVRERMGKIDGKYIEYHAEGMTWHDVNVLQNAQRGVMEPGTLAVNPETPFATRFMIEGVRGAFIVDDQSPDIPLKTLVIHVGEGRAIFSLVSALIDDVHRVCAFTPQEAEE